MQNKWFIPLGLVALISGVYFAVTFGKGVDNGAYIGADNFGADNFGADNSQSLQAQTQFLNWYPEPRKLADFEITQHNQSPMNKQTLEGKWTLAFVGYTYCPDICPATLANINKVYPELKQLASDKPLQVWFLSVDPKRDTIERLNEYVSYFNPDFIASTGEHAQLFPLVRSMGMMYSIAGATDDPNYLVDHSASIVVINPEGNVVGRFKPVHKPGQLATSDMQQLLVDVPLLLASS